MKYIWVMAGVLLSASTLADDRPVASEEIILEYKVYCSELAEDEGTDGLSLDEYLLSCINEELDIEGYQPIKAVPK
ncbi:hypothetical protein ACOJR9_01100 [Alteromonas sp. A081]|uniref:hypothetical protein n=1 Tax=Alteromonas sp. A081 TaxID=3410269 RepID=UPI003B97F3C3